MTVESITGRVASDPSAKVMRDGAMTAQFFIQDEQSVYYQVVCYYSLAERVATFLKIGTLATIRGKFKTDEWIDNKNLKHWSTRILAIRIEILDSTEPKAAEDIEQVLG